MCSAAVEYTPSVFNGGCHCFFSSASSTCSAPSVVFENHSWHRHCSVRNTRQDRRRYTENQEGTLCKGRPPHTKLHVENYITHSHSQGHIPGKNREKPGVVCRNGVHQRRKPHGRMPRTGQDCPDPAYKLGHRTPHIPLLESQSRYSSGGEDAKKQRGT